MSKKLYVGNLPFSTNEDELRDLFAAYGEVTSVKLIEDRETGRLRGFGFVEMAADGAILADDVHRICVLPNGSDRPSGASRAREK